MKTVCITLFCCLFNVTCIMSAESAEDYKRLVQKFNTELQSNLSKAKKTLEDIKGSWNDATAVSGHELLEEIAVGLGAQQGEDIYTFMNNFLNGLNERFLKKFNSHGAPLSSTSAPAVSPTVANPVRTASSAPLGATRASVALSAAPVPPARPTVTTTVVACPVRGGVPITSTRSPARATPLPSTAASAGVPKGVNVAQQMLIDDMRKQGQAIMANVKINVEAEIKKYFEEKKSRGQLKQKDLEKIDIDGLQARVNSAFGLGFNFFATTFGR